MKVKNFFLVLIFAWASSTTILAKVISQEKLDLIVKLIQENEISPIQEERIKEAFLSKASKAPIAPKKKRPISSLEELIKPDPEYFFKDSFETLVATPCLSPPDKARAVKKMGIGERTIFVSPAHVEGDMFKAREHDNNVIYAHMLTKGQDPLIDRNDRIDFPSLLGGLPITEGNLNHALLAIENKVRGWIHGNRRIYFNTTYIGLAEKLVSRAHGHGASFNAFNKELAAAGFMKTCIYEKDLEYDDEEVVAIDMPLTCDDMIPLGNGKKVKFSRKAARLMQANIRMSPLVYNIPKHWLKVVEVLVGTLFNSTQKAGTLLGDEASKERIDQYLKWRQNMVAAAKKKKEKLPVNYFGQVENLHRRDLVLLLGLRLNKK